MSIPLPQGANEYNSVSDVMAVQDQAMTVSPFAVRQGFLHLHVFSREVPESPMNRRNV